MKRCVLTIGVGLCVACSRTAELPTEDVPPAVSAGPPPVATTQQRGGEGSLFLKGQLHCHSNASGDSDTPPEVAASWYAKRGYDFIVFTDHNRITDLPAVDGMLVLPGIELTQNVEQCAPAPEAGMRCLLHVNGLVVDPSKADRVASLLRPDSLERADLFTHAVRVTEQLGGVSMLNHPNFHYAADAPLIAAVAAKGLGLLEVANEAVDSNNEGDATHPSTEQIWDGVLTAGARVWGTATDDAHHYEDADETRKRGELAFVGDRGWVMVRAQRTGQAIRDALEAGDFYSSNGVTLLDVRADHGVLEVEVDPSSPGDHAIRFIGGGGKVLDQTMRRKAAFDLGPRDTPYVRAVVEDSTGRKAWTQPLFKSDE